MGTRKLTTEEKEKLVDQSQEKLAEEGRSAEVLFDGLHQAGPPGSKYLADYYNHLGSKIYVEKDIRQGQGVTVKHPSIAQIEDYCKLQNNTMFYDIYFPPCNDSLYRMSEYAQEKPKDKRPQIIWKRPTEFFKAKDGQFRLFAKIEANDIRQGLLGDCWLMCSLSAGKINFYIIKMFSFLNNLNYEYT
jgi:hypothetical protein